MIYFTSDLHFHHKKVIEYAQRPFADVETMNRVLIERWNQRVEARDSVYILGDITLKGALLMEECVSQLRGKKYLVTGNHDLFVKNEKVTSQLFEDIQPYMELSSHSQNYVLFHYPMEEWNGCFRAAIHLHGHIHGTPRYNEREREEGRRRYDVGVDANHYAPVSEEEIVLFFAQMPEREQERMWNGRER